MYKNPGSEIATKKYAVKNPLNLKFSLLME